VPILKADLHCHVRGDPRDGVDYTAEELFDRAALQGFDVIAITNHREVWHNPGALRYAQRRGLLVIPGVELDIEQKHVLLINVDTRAESIQSFDDIRATVSRDRLVVAPHPFYPTSTCLGGKLIEHIDVFDAIEYSFFYCSVLNPNRRAKALAQRNGKPMLGSSDCHSLQWIGRTYTLIEADGKDIGSVVHAVKEGRVQVVGRPIGVLDFATACIRNFAGLHI